MSFNHSFQCEVFRRLSLADVGVGLSVGSGLFASGCFNRSNCFGAVGGAYLEEVGVGIGVGGGLFWSGRFIFSRSLPGAGGGVYLTEVGLDIGVGDSIL